MTTTTAPSAESIALAQEKNATLIACRSCPTTWLQVMGSRLALPGYHEPSANWHGSVVTGWHSLGARVGMVRHDDRVSLHVTDEWLCLCGVLIQVARRAMEHVPCRHGAKPDDVCAKRAEERAPDLYTNARYGGACPCCGQQGSHLVFRGDTPPCVTL